VIDEGELADDLARSHQRDDAFSAPIRRNRDFDQALLDAIAAIAAVAGHKERFPSLGDALERACEQLRRHLRRQAGKNHTRPLYYAHARALIRQCVGVTHGQLLAALLRPASRAEKATEPSPGVASWWPPLSEKAAWLLLSGSLKLILSSEFYNDSSVNEARQNRPFAGIIAPGCRRFERRSSSMRQPHT
jgi:hypothetical protein